MRTLRLTEMELARLLKKRGAAQASPMHSRSEVARRPASALHLGRAAEIEFDEQLVEAGYAGRYRREYRFLPDRKFRLDFAFVAEKIAIEIDGAVHRIHGRFVGDREKFNLATLARWRVLHVSPQDVRDGSAVELLTRALALLARAEN